MEIPIHCYGILNYFLKLSTNSRNVSHFSNMIYVCWYIVVRNSMGVPWDFHGISIEFPSVVLKIPSKFPWIFKMFSKPSFGNPIQSIIV